MLYPYMRTYHPSYEKLGGVPAISRDQILLSISNRGCFGGMQFLCADLPSGADHSDQKPRIHWWRRQSFSPRSRISRVISTMWAGLRRIFGSGPARNRRRGASCPNRQCLFPEALQEPSGQIMRIIWSCSSKLRELPKVKKVFIRSGIRFRLCAGGSRRYLFPGAVFSIMSAAS